MAYIDNITKILQIQPDGLPTFVRLSQNENGRNLYFQLAGNEIDIPANSTVTISGTKPDGNVYSGTGSVTDNVVLIPEMLQMTAVAGTWDAKVKITSGGNTIATGRVRFIVDADTVAPGSVPSSSELEGLVAEAQQYAETARTEAYGSPLTAQTAAGMTDHTRVYVYTGSETGYTAGHWYYWNGSAWTDGGIYNSVAVNTDPTLTLTGVAADAKAAGDAIDAAVSDLKSDLNTLDSSLFNQSVSIPRLTGNTYWTFGQEVVAETGANRTTDKGCRTTYVPFSEPLRIVLDDPDYNFVVWVYTAQSVASAIYSPTKKYADDTVLIQPLSTPVYFRIGVERKDGTDLTTDYADTTSDAYKIITATKTYTMNGRMCVNKIACFGDSIMLGRDGSGSGSARTEYTIPKAIAKRLGCVCDNYAVGGQGYIERTGVPKAYSTISAVDLTQYNAVVMCFGVNDGYHVLGEWNSTDENTIMGQFNKIVNYIYTQNKQIRVIVFAPFNGCNVGTFPDYWYGERDSEYVSRKILSDTLKRACDYYWIPYVEQYDCPINPLNITEALPDGTHPSNNYYCLLSDWVAAKVNGLL